jgi:hypothetical protein
MAQEGLGRAYDFSIGNAPVDYNTAGATGKRVSLRNCGGVAVLLNLAVAGGGTDAVVCTLKQHTASTSGTSADLAVIDHFYVKFEALLDGDEQWTRVTQAAGATITLAGATYAATEVLLCLEVNATSLSDGYDYISFDVADPGTGGARLGSVTYVLRDLAVQRAPANLVAPLS